MLEQLILVGGVDLVGELPWSRAWVSDRLVRFLRLFFRRLGLRWVGQVRVGGARSAKMRF